MKKNLMVLSGLVLGVVPVVALAQTATNCAANANQGTLFSVLCTVGNFLNAVVPVLVMLGVVYFVWGVISYVIASDEEAKTTGRNRMIWGIIGLAVIIGMWGLVNILGKTFGVGSNPNSAPITLPGVNLQ
jgi:predicted membrane channel-forming protein YqfA (hemolysin III family)